MVHGWSKPCVVPLMQHSRTLLRNLAVLLATQHLQQDSPAPLAVFHRQVYLHAEIKALV